MSDSDEELNKDNTYCLVKNHVGQQVYCSLVANELIERWEEMELKVRRYLALSDQILQLQSHEMRDEVASQIKVIRDELRNLVK